MERKIGEVFEFNGVKLKTVRVDVPFRCEDCYFKNMDILCEKVNCLDSERTDNENVIFNETKKSATTREEVKELLPVMHAYAEGKTIQVWTNDSWQDEEYPYFGEPSQFRIKPEPKYRPFKSMEECWQEMQNHHPFGWIKRDGKYVNITLVSGGCSYDKHFETVTFADGTPFGIKEE